MAFTVEFDENGMITQVFSGRLVQAEGSLIRAHKESTPAVNPPAPGVMSQGVRAMLRPKAVSNITSVTILTTEDHDPCIKDGTGREWCW